MSHLKGRSISVLTNMPSAFATEIRIEAVMEGTIPLDTVRYR